VLWAALAAASLATGCGRRIAAPAEGAGEIANDASLFADEPSRPFRERPLGAETPSPVPPLSRPTIAISLSSLRLDLVDAATGFCRSYPIGVGQKDGPGASRTPIGRFETGPDPSDTWWYVPARSSGLPFLRLTATNARGEHPYGLHAPRDGRFREGYVSDGCIRLRPRDMVELFAAVRGFASTPVTIRP
jgi:lipoprotein-anchoring transpeptidase ErfK/SrfK